MRTLLVGTALLALMAPAAYAQQAHRGAGGGVAASEQAEPGHFLVFFALNQATLTADARRVIAQAAEEYRRTGAARVGLAGYADRSASAAYNQRLSERRAEAVRRELERRGVAAGSIDLVARGEDDPLVPTADGVREAKNRRVEIMVPSPGTGAAPAAVAQAPAPMMTTPTPAPEQMQPMQTADRGPGPERFVFSLGPVYGHNFREQDEGHTKSDMLGAELVFNALPNVLGGVSLKQDVLWSFDAVDDGLAGRTVASIDVAPDLGFVRPRFSLNFGGVYGNGVQDGLVAGPEVGLDLKLPAGITLRPKLAYDYQFRNPGWDQGILWTGLDLGIRF